LQPIIALIAGILILIVPRILNYVVALYLILIGLVSRAPTQSRKPPWAVGAVCSYCSPRSRRFLGGRDVRP
jgi:DUF3096 family protein